MPKKSFKSHFEQTETYAQHQSRSKLIQKAKYENLAMEIQLLLFKTTLPFPRQTEVDKLEFCPLLSIVLGKRSLGVNNDRATMCFLAGWVVVACRSTNR